MISIMFAVFNIKYLLMGICVTPRSPNLMRSHPNLTSEGPSNLILLRHLGQIQTDMGKLNHPHWAVHIGETEGDRCPRSP